jgi:hypothetical protein
MIPATRKSGEISDSTWARTQRLRQARERKRHPYRGFANGGGAGRRPACYGSVGLLCHASIGWPCAPAMRATRVARTPKAFVSPSEAGGDRERHPKKLDAALGERCGRLVDERRGIGDAASTARDAWCSEAETSAQFEEAAAAQVGQNAAPDRQPSSRAVGNANRLSCAFKKSKSTGLVMKSAAPYSLARRRRSSSP